MSQSALTAILREAKKMPLPDISRRDDIRLARNMLGETMTPYGLVLQQVPLPYVEGGKVWLLDVAAFWPMLYVIANRSLPFARLVRSTIDRLGPSTPIAPWRMALYTDEVDPGDQISGYHARKMQAVYWSLLEFGAAALSHESCWFTACCARSKEVKKVAGKMSGLVCGLLKLAFCSSHDPTSAGIVLDLADDLGQVRIHIKFGMKTGDEAAIAEVNCTRGAGAEMVCFCCYNCKNKNSVDFKYDESGFFVDQTELDMSKFRFHTDDSVRDLYRDLEARSRVESNACFTKSQKMCGFTFHRGSILLEARLNRIYKPISSVVFDWMHCILISGVFAVTFGHLMVSLKPFRITYATLHAYVQDWHWPGRISSRGVTGKDACKKAKKWYETKKFTPSASEILSLYAVFAHYFMNARLDGEIRRPEVTCFLLLCDVIDTCMLMGRCIVSSQRLFEVVHRFLESFRFVFGGEHMTWKWHALLHLPHQLMLHGILFPCFVHERKHRSIKRFGAQLQNTALNYEGSVIADVTDYHLATLDEEDFAFCPRLVGPPMHKPPLALLDALRAVCGNVAIELGRVARFNEWCTGVRGDVVMCNIQGNRIAGKVACFASVDAVLVVLVELWQEFDRHPGGSRWTTKGPALSMLDADQILDTLIWRDDGHGVVTAITPPWLT